MEPNSVFGDIYQNHSSFHACIKPTSEVGPSKETPPLTAEEIHTVHLGDAILKLNTQEREDDDIEQHWSLETDAIRYGDMDANDLLYSKPWDLLICSDTMRVWGAQLTLKMVYDESYGEIEESERLAIENSMA